MNDVIDRHQDRGILPLSEVRKLKYEEDIEYLIEILSDEEPIAYGKDVSNV